MTPRLKKQASDRLARIGGQVRGIARMVGEDVYCIDVLSQLNSVSAAVDGLRVLLLDDHIRTCVAEAVRSGDDEKLEELNRALRRLVRA